MTRPFVLAAVYHFSYDSYDSLEMESILEGKMLEKISTSYLWEFPCIAALNIFQQKHTHAQWCLYVIIAHKIKPKIWLFILFWFVLSFKSTAHDKWPWPGRSDLSVGAVEWSKQEFWIRVGRCAPCYWELPTSENHRKGQLRQGQTGSPYPHRKRGGMSRVISVFPGAQKATGVFPETHVAVLP